MAGVPVGLDFGAVMTLGSALDADVDLLADVLPEFELALLAGMSGDTSEE